MGSAAAAVTAAVTDKGRAIPVVAAVAIVIAAAASIVSRSSRSIHGS